MRRSRSVVASSIAAALLAAAMGCHPSMEPLHPVIAPPPVCIYAPGTCSDSVVITYLGVSGFLIRAHGSAILTAPSFTHPSIPFVVLPFLPVSPNKALIDWTLAREPLSDATAILVGHSHYDHLLDVPYIADVHAPKAGIFGSVTTANTLAPVTALAGRVRAIRPTEVGTATQPGTWFITPGSGIRFMAFQSSHAPNLRLGFINYTYANDIETAPRGSLPRTAHGWHLGEVYAYLIDVLDAAGKPIFRIFYQDAAAEPQYSTLPPLPDGHGVDLVIICTGNFENATDYPLPLLTALSPKRVIVAHWEDFFLPPWPPFKGIRMTNTELLAHRLKTSVPDRWITPEPMARMVYRY